ncbi:hypothetical protein PanWU01x14_368710 [Parasponia andersonii]|uniref:Uncharacterized protein n=1 Tax=Parasponia andersonii TaxID=3476 RepID=A0A2P5A514_PARAD|nr:hypothetical protein PanWU01x14_368710 [Parasponia andersonii]
MTKRKRPKFVLQDVYGTHYITLKGQSFQKPFHAPRTSWKISAISSLSADIKKASKSSRMSNILPKFTRYRMQLSDAFWSLSSTFLASISSRRLSWHASFRSEMSYLSAARRRSSLWDRNSSCWIDVYGGELFLLEVMREHTAKNRRSCCEDSAVSSDAAIGGVDHDIGVDAFCQHSAKGGESRCI